MYQWILLVDVDGGGRGRRWVCGSGGHRWWRTSMVSDFGEDGSGGCRWRTILAETALNSRCNSICLLEVYIGGGWTLESLGFAVGLPVEASGNRTAAAKFGIAMLRARPGICFGLGYLLGEKNHGKRHERVRIVTLGRK